MPRIPKKIPMRSATFPQPMYRSATGEYNRYNPIYAKAFKEDLGLDMVQGPDMPWPLENRRQAMKAAQEAYEAELAEERARQAYNRKIAAWNEYVSMSPEERRFWANRGKLEDAMMDYKLDVDPSWYTENYENFTHIPLRPTPDYNSATRRSVNIYDYPSYDDFDKFPDELSDAPWRR